MKRRPLIMVVDDNREVLKLLHRALELENYHAVVASNGTTALSFLKTKRPDLVILDIMMPELDGLEVLRRLRRSCQVPVIMLTAKTGVTNLNRALELGADDYITKPFSIRELMARVRAKLRRASMKG